MTSTAEVLVDPSRKLGTIDDGIYGQFIEQMGRVIYGGLFDPTSPLADAEGFRTDVMDAVRGLRPSVLRIGGNKSSGYHWRDGVGPRSSRPHRRDLAWGFIDPNTFGTDEFIHCSRLAGAEPYISLNMGTGTIDEALEWLEYCNGTEAGIPEVALRNGPPHEVRLWGLGNELYGWWQHGHRSATAYAEDAREYGKLLRWADNRVRLVAVGWAENPDWNATVLDVAARAIDWISLHYYWRGEPKEILAGPASAERSIVDTYAMCEQAAERHNLARPIRIAVDEWGVWSKTFPKMLTTPGGHTTIMERGMAGAFGDTSFEESYDLVDAIAVASWLHVLWRHPEKVTLATQAQMVNTIAPILTTPDRVVKQTIYWPMWAARRWAGSTSLDVAVRSDDDIDVAATFDEASGRLHVSLVNRSLSDEVEVTLKGIDPVTIVRLTHDDAGAANTAEHPTVVVPVDAADLVLPPLSHTTVVSS